MSCKSGNTPITRERAEIPKFYWDALSKEERKKAICSEFRNKLRSIEGVDDQLADELEKLVSTLITVTSDGN